MKISARNRLRGAVAKGVRTKRVRIDAGGDVVKVPGFMVAFD